MPNTQYMLQFPVRPKSIEIEIFKLKRIPFWFPKPNWVWFPHDHDIQCFHIIDLRKSWNWKSALELPHVSKSSQVDSNKKDSLENSELKLPLPFFLQPYIDTALSVLILILSLVSSRERNLSSHSPSPTIRILDRKDLMGWVCLSVWMDGCTSHL